MSKLFWLLAVVTIAALIIGIFLFTTYSKRTAIVENITIPVNENIPKDTPRLSIVAKDLQVPWSLAFLPDGSLLVTERPGRVRMISREGTLLPEALLNLEVVQKIQGEGGLHGVVIHPDFEKNRFVYLYYTYENQGNKSLNRVVRYIFGDGKLIEDRIIVDKIPGALFHDGGRIKFGPDGYLYITTGDAQKPSLAQDKNSLAGKILRVTDTGAAALDNPFGNLVYSYGHRNPQGITWDDQGRLWQTEHGQNAKDELNLIEMGKNYGWPTIQGSETKDGLVSPVAQSGSDTWAPGGAAYLSGSVYFVGLKGQSLYEAKLSDNTSTIKSYLHQELGRIRDVIIGPDSMLYVTTSNRDGRGVPGVGDDKIIRVNPAKL